MSESIITDQILLGIAIGIAFDELGKRIIATRLRTLLGVGHCDAEDDDEADRDNTGTAGGDAQDIL